MKYAAVCLAMLAPLFVVGCGNKPTATTTTTGTDIRQSNSPPTYQPMQPVQPVTTISDNSPTSPVTVATATPAIAGSSYTVQKGDTLFKIARAKYGDASAVRKIKEANPGLDADHIKVGQKINLP